MSDHETRPTPELVPDLDLLFTDANGGSEATDPYRMKKRRVRGPGWSRREGQIGPAQVPPAPKNQPNVPPPPKTCRCGDRTCPRCCAAFDAQATEENRMNQPGRSIGFMVLTREWPSVPARTSNCSPAPLASDGIHGATATSLRGQRESPLRQDARG